MFVHQEANIPTAAVNCWRKSVRYVPGAN